jgi:hypothetical protein
MAKAEEVSTKPLIDKLGVRPGSRVAVLRMDDAAFGELLNSRTTDISRGRLRKGCDCIFFRANTPQELERLVKLKEYLKPNGAIWVVSLKGKTARITVVGVIAAALQAGLVDNKVVSFSETEKAVRLSVPLSQRKAVSQAGGASDRGKAMHSHMVRRKL